MITKEQIEEWASLCEGEEYHEEVKFPGPSYPIEPYVVHITDDKEFLKKYRNEIFDLIQKAYSEKGGFLGADNPRTLIKDSDRAKLVFDGNGNIIACALYRTDIGGFKRFGSAGIKGNEESFKAVQDIIKSDIEPYNGWYWVEASETIEKLFKKMNGNPIPNSLADYFLNLDFGKIRYDIDNVHYFRNVNGVEKRKMLFGFKNEKSKELAEESVENYGEFKLGINNMDSRINESNDKLQQSLIEARTFLSRLFDLHYEEKINEILPSWYDRLVESMKLIGKNMNIIPEDERDMYKAAMKRGMTCKDSMTILKFTKITL